MSHIDWVEVAINWFPMLLLVGVWAFFLTRMRSGPYAKQQQEAAATAKRQADALERIAAALEKRGA